MIYKVVTRCYWNRRLWELDQEVDLGPEVIPPKHFVPLSQYKEPPVSTVKDPMKPIPMSYGKPVMAQGGFASKLDESTQALAQQIQNRPKGRARKS
jgi:hypothetical protein